MMKMDERQDKAVNSFGSDILVSASAGAGKTRVLVERLLKRCVKDRISLNEILAVTFTEAAAAEMKNRIAKGLQDLAKTADDEAEREYIRKQLILLSDADITTIDGFCLDIIRKYYSVIGMDPARVNNVLDESAGNELHDIAFERALEEYDRENHEVLVRFLKSVSPRPEDFGILQEMVKKTEAQCSQYGDGEEWLSQAELSAAGIHTLNDLPSAVKEAFFNALTLHYETIDHYLQMMEETAVLSEKAKKKIKDLAFTRTLLLSCEAPLKERNYSFFREMFLAFGNEQKTPAGTDYEPYKKARESFYKACGDLTKLLYEEEVLLRDIREISPLIECLCSLTRRTMHHFSELKREKACMDFADMEHFAWQILSANSGAVATLFKNRLREVMVDEFQDTSLLQNEIIEAVSPAGTIFRVGDVKQSMYRFRGAKPSLMRSLIRDSSILNIVLNHNYRSKENIISFSNILFQKLMNISGCEDTYSEDDIVSPGTPSQKLAEPDPIRLVLLQGESEEDEALPPSEEGEADNDGESYSEKEYKAGWIASEMIRLHESGYSWRDFCVLVKSHGDKLILKRVFDQCGIPSEIDTREGFYNSDLCRCILSLLECISGGGNDISLLSVLSGELFDFDDETFADLKLNYGSVRAGIEHLHPEIPEWFHHLSMTAEEGLTRLLDEIACTNSFYEKLPDSQKANFDFLYEKTVQFNAQNRTIRDLIRMMSAGDDEKSSSACSTGRDDDVVSAVTIHHSKGLQYRVVFLWSTGRNTFMDSRSELILDPEVFFGLKHYDLPFRTARPTVFRIAAQYRQSMADIEEFIRVLYVALTRAEEKLYIVDSEKSSQPFCDIMSVFELSRRKGITGLISSALQEIPGLFTIDRVPCADFTKTSRREPRYVNSLPVYQGNEREFPPITKPSRHEFTVLPDLDPSGSERGTAYGTRIHEIIASLPNRTWTIEDFEATGLSDGVISHLLAFSQSGLYQSALHTDIHKEMPFYTEDPETKERLMGVIDFAAIGEDRILLIDFKTDNASLHQIETRYRDQLLAYQRALTLLYPEKTVDTYAWSLHNDAELRIH